MVSGTRTPVKRTSNTISSPSSSREPKPKLLSTFSLKKEIDTVETMPLNNYAHFDDKINVCLKNDQMDNAIFWADKKLSYVKNENDNFFGTITTKVPFVAIVDYLRVLTAAQAWVKVTDFVQAEDCVFSHVCLTYYYVNSLWQQKMHAEIVQLPMSLINMWEEVPVIQPQDHELKYSSKHYYPTEKEKITLNLMEKEGNVEAALLLILGKTYIRVVNREAASAALKSCIRMDPTCFEAWSLILKYHLLKKEAIITFLSQLSEIERENELFDIVKLYVETYIDKKEEDLPKENIATAVNTTPEAAASSSRPARKSLSNSKKKFDEPQPPSRFHMRTRSNNNQQQDQSLEEETIIESVKDLSIRNERLKDKLADDVDMISLEALKNFNSGDNYKALQITDDLFKKYGSSPNFFYLHLAVLTELKKTCRLFEIAHNLVERCPENEISWYAIGCYYMAIENWYAAKTFFHKTIQINSNFGEGWMAMGHANALGGEHEQSMNCYFRAHRLLEGSWEPLMYIGIEHMKTNNLTLSANFLADSLSLAEDNIMVLLEMGAMYYGQNRSSLAEKYFNKALNSVLGLEPDAELNDQMLEVKLHQTISTRWESLMNNLGMLYRVLKRYERAIMFHKKAMSMEYRDPSNLISMGMCYAYMGMYGEALAIFNEAASPKLLIKKIRQQIQHTTKRGTSIDDLVSPIQLKANNKPASEIHIDGVVKVAPNDVSLILDSFIRNQTIREISKEHGMTDKLFMGSFKSFRHLCIFSPDLDLKLKVILSDIHTKKASVELLFNEFLVHAKRTYPHLESMDDLKMISDLTQPHNWYPQARNILRKIVFHAGPTNSGKTWSALERFKSAKSGVYCGPLRLLACEVFQKCNDAGIPCDLMTGEDRRFVRGQDDPADHTASTVEMLSVTRPVEVAVIDEIQMVRDDQRGFAFTRALLGVPAEEIHVCGEVAAIDIVKKLLDPIGEHVEIRTYERKTSLSICDYGVGNYQNIQKGDAIVCFSKRRVFSIVNELKKLNIPTAVIYGSLPPAVKLAQSAKFNDPEDPVKVLVATDAIGMGLNLNIQRVIFDSLVKPPNNELIQNHAALQIAGRAGRFGTTFANGQVLPMKDRDVSILKTILSKPVEAITSAGIAPTFEQLETFSYHLPNATLVNLLDIFVSICSVNEHYFMCDIEETRNLALLLESIQLPLNVRYGFCLAPIQSRNKMVSTALVKMARRFSTRQTISYDWMCDLIKYPFNDIHTLEELNAFTDVFQIIELYLWLSYRFSDMFPDYTEVRQLELEANDLMQEALKKITT
uniref:RNA helicase n=1 Tax=Rhabditophanes sp. KR3021 TaxID=114890 RepID=A0AC35UBG9_9BILA